MKLRLTKKRKKNARNIFNCLFSFYFKSIVINEYDVLEQNDVLEIYDFVYILRLLNLIPIKKN